MKPKKWGSVKGHGSFGILLLGEKPEQLPEITFYISHEGRGGESFPANCK
jgi:hypothetical protein